MPKRTNLHCSDEQRLPVVPFVNTVYHLSACTHKRQRGLESPRRWACAREVIALRKLSEHQRGCRRLVTSSDSDGKGRLTARQQIAQLKASPASDGACCAAVRGTHPALLALVTSASSAIRNRTIVARLFNAAMCSAVFLQSPQALGSFNLVAPSMHRHPMHGASSARTHH